MPDLPKNTPQFFLDDTWIAEARRLTRRWLPAFTNPEPVLRSDRPWEGPALVLYGSVLPDPAGGWRLYYSTFLPSCLNVKQGAPYVLLAHSPDGLRWEKPDLDVLPAPAGGPSNVVLPAHAIGDAPSVIFDPEDASAPWKLLGFSWEVGTTLWSESWGLYGFTSPDGLHWSPASAPGVPLLRAGDRTNLMAERVDGEYWAYTRHFQMFDQVGSRAIYLTRSADFRAWTEPELVLAPDLTDEPDVELYGMAVFRRHGWFFGLLEYWRSDVDCLEVHLAYSPDGKHWQRPAPHTPFIAAQYPWNAKWSTCASNGPIVRNEQMLFYFGGRGASHHWDSARLDGAIGYASLPLDRFCALEGLNHGGRLTTPAFTWPGGDLVLNADTRESFESHPLACNGEIAVEMLDAAGEPLPEWSGEQRAVFHDNTHCRGEVHSGKVLWPPDRGLGALAGQVVRLRFSLRHARLFTFAASEVAP